MQNRKSAKKCRLKKKAEYSTMQEEFEKVNQENNDLKNQVRPNILLIDAGKPNHDDALPKNRGERTAHQQVGAVSPGLESPTEHPTATSSCQQH